MPKLPPLDEFRAPWETEAGGDTEIDKPKLKRYIHGILADKEKLQTHVTEVTTERDTLKKAADDKAREGESEVDRLKRENEELKGAAAKAPEATQEVLKLRVALAKGLTEVQAKRLVGTTEEELTKDADELLASFGGQGSGAEEDGSDGGARRAPRRFVNGGDPAPDDAAPISVEKGLELIPRIN